jgi:hypothetical protein
MGELASGVRIFPYLDLLKRILRLVPIVVFFSTYFSQNVVLGVVKGLAFLSFPEPSSDPGVLPRVVLRCMGSYDGLCFRLAVKIFVYH